MVRDLSGLRAGMNSCWRTSVVAVMLPYWQTHPTLEHNLPKNELFHKGEIERWGRQVDEVAFEMR
jgi:hypothetical protein